MRLKRTASRGVWFLRIDNCPHVTFVSDRPMHSTSMELIRAWHQLSGHQARLLPGSPNSDLPPRVYKLYFVSDKFYTSVYPWRDACTTRRGQSHFKLWLQFTAFWFWNVLALLKGSMSRYLRNIRSHIVIIRTVYIICMWFIQIM